MESIILCNKCKLKYDLKELLPKILPCSCLLCLKCIKEEKNELDEYVITCSSCQKIHLLTNLDSLLTSDIILHILSNTNSSNEPSNALSILNNYSNKIAQNINTQKEETIKHYESVLMDIDNRAERVIQLIHNGREILQDQMNIHRCESMEHIEKNNSCKNNNIQSELISFDHDMHTLLNEQSVDQKEFDRVRKHFDQIRQKNYEIKNLSWYFAENTSSLNSCLLGYLLNNKIDRNYFKIKNLQYILNSDSIAFKVALQSEFEHAILRQEVLPLSKNRIIKIYFTTSRALYFELFDGRTGKSIKLIKAFENLSSFPISCGYGNYFCVCFTSKDCSQSQYNHMNSNFIRLYDLNLILIKSLQKFTSIESIYMNETQILLYFSHKVTECCEIYDNQLNYIQSFGQQTLIDGPFYMEKSDLTTRQQMNLNFKLNPRIFGFTKDFIYFWNYNKMSVMNRLTGLIVKTLTLHGDRPYFMLDSQSHIIQVNPLAKRITLYNHGFEMIISNIYNDALDLVHINKEDQLTFIDVEKKLIIHI